VSSFKWVNYSTGRPRPLGHLTNFCTNFYQFFLISENSLKFAIFFAEVTNSRSMAVTTQTATAACRHGETPLCSAALDPHSPNLPNSPMPAVNFTTGLSRHRLSPYNAYYLKYTTLYLYSSRSKSCAMHFLSVNRDTINTTLWQYIPMINNSVTEDKFPDIKSKSSFE